EIIVEKHNSKFPQSEEELLSLPGIGKYTARAVLCFAFEQQISVVDTNVRKVILTQVLNSENTEYSEIRTVQKTEDLIVRDSDTPSGPSFLTKSDTKIDERLIENIATQLLPSGKAYEWNQALMDYAAAVLKKEKIPIYKQSKFKGSRRYYRGQILKMILEKKKIPIDDLGILIKNDFTIAEKKWLLKLLEDVEKEGFIRIKHKSVELAS